MIICPQPARREPLDFLDGLEQVLPQPVIAHCPVVTLDIGVLLRITGLDMLKPNAALLRPSTQAPADISRTIVAANDFGSAPPLDDLLQGTNDAFSRQRQIDLDAQPFPIRQ